MLVEAIDVTSFIFLFFEVGKFFELVNPVLLEVPSASEIRMREDSVNGRSSSDVLAHAFLEQVVVLSTTILNLRDGLIYNGFE